MNLKNRSYQKELLDNEDIPAYDLNQNLKELDFINRWLGGHAITIEGLKQFASKKQINICEIGCGGGDNLVALNKWCSRNGINASFIGVDIKQDCIYFAKQKPGFSNVTWIVNDYREATFSSKPDIIFSSLFTHHFNDDEIIFQLGWMKTNSNLGFFINDLERNFLAYQLIKWLTKFFSRSYLVKHDAPLSVARGFTKHEWKKLLEKAQINNYTVQWKWAFRFLVVYKHDELNNI